MAIKIFDNSNNLVAVVDFDNKNKIISKSKKFDLDLKSILISGIWYITDLYRDKDGFVDKGIVITDIEKLNSGSFQMVDNKLRELGYIVNYT